MIGEPIHVLDLFCGAGGLAQGFESAFNMLGVDISDEARKTFEKNIGNRFQKADLKRESIIGNFDIIIGGPPCKPWSSVNVTKRGENHKDHVLLSRFFDHVEHHSPKIFLLENVPPVANDKVFLSYIAKLGKTYSIEKNIIKYSNFGAPTSRHRLIVFGTMKGNAAEFFSELNNYKKPPKTVKEVIWRLRNKKKGDIPDHVWPELKTIRKYKHYYKTGKFGWYILDWDKPAPSFGNIMKTYILHPEGFKSNNPRVISVKEALLIMGFNDKFSFPSDIGIGKRYQMTVDSVSPVFSKVLAKIIEKIYNREFT